MQAENAAEREKSKKDRQYPTPPARSKASGLGVSKELINFLLDHDVPSLRFSTHARDGLCRLEWRSDYGGLSKERPPSLLCGDKRKAAATKAVFEGFAWCVRRRAWVRRGRWRAAICGSRISERRGWRRDYRGESGRWCGDRKSGRRPRRERRRRLPWRSLCHAWRERESSRLREDLRLVGRVRDGNRRDRFPRQRRPWIFLRGSRSRNRGVASVRRCGGILPTLLLQRAGARRRIGLRQGRPTWLGRRGNLLDDGGGDGGERFRSREIARRPAAIQA